MRLEASVAGFATSFALLFAAPPSTAADSKPPIRLEAIGYKENGRLDPKIVAECNIEQDLRGAMNYVLARQASTGTPRGVTFRIDKAGNLGSMGLAGTELGVTAIPAGRDTGQLFLCQKKASVFNASHCSRVTECARKIAEDVVDWMNRTS